MVGSIKDTFGENISFGSHISPDLSELAASAAAAEDVFFLIV
jgi:hypothetical protein